MRRWISLFLLLFFSFVLPFPLYAFNGTEGATFLELPVGARPAALGSAYTMLAEDAYAPTWNPGALGFIDSPQVSGMHMLYLENSSYEYGSFAMPLSGGRGVGAAIQYFRPGDITGLDANANPIGDVSGYYANYTLALGQSFGDTFGIGISGNLVRARLDDVSAQSFAGTGGFLFRPSAKWRIGGVIANVGQKLSFLSSQDALPLVYRGGVAYHPTPPWTIAVEGAKLQSGQTSMHTGLEYETPFGFTVRTGYNSEKTKELTMMAGFSFGASMLIYGQDFGYAWIPVSDLGSSHIFSVVWRFGHAKNKEEDMHKLERPPKEEDMGIELEN